MVKRIVLGVVLLAGQWVEADTMADAKALAETKNAGIKAAASTDTQMPVQYQGSNVPETGLYDSGAALETEAAEKVAVDADARELYLQNANRPRMVLDPATDPTLIQARHIGDQATAFVQSGAQGCITLGSQGERTTTSTHSCTVQGYQEAIDFSCSDTYQASCSNSDLNTVMGLPFANVRVTSSSQGVELKDEGDGTFAVASGHRFQNCDFYTDVVEFDVPAGYEIQQLSYQVKYWDDWLFLIMNGRTRENAPEAWWTQGMVGDKRDVQAIEWWWTCERHAYSSNSYTFNLLPYANTSAGSTNRLEFKHKVGGSGKYKVEVTVMLRRLCDIKFTSQHSCTQGQTDAAIDLEQTRAPYCSDNAPLSRQVPGTTDMATLNCWQTSTDYRTWAAPYYVEDSSCDLLRQSGCQQVNSGDCLINHARGYCESAVVDFDCGTYAEGGSVDLCSTELLCQDGECTDEYNQPYDATEDFKQAAATLAMVDEAAINLDQDTMSIWTGDAMTCKKTDFSVKDCCKDSGWGLDLGVTHCSSQEQTLGQAKEAGKTLYVGSEEFGSWPEEYTRKKYCVYPSKLARIVMQQAIPLLGENFGNYAAPNCRGLLLSEFSRLDFERIDLSEYFSDVMARANLALEDMPSTEELLDRIQQNLQAIQQ